MRLALAAVAALALLAAACGGVENEPNLAKAVERTTASGSSRIEVRGKDDSAEPGLYVCEGVADYARRRLQFSCTLDGDHVMSLRAVDGFVYFDESGTGEKWFKDVDDDEENALGDFSPEKLLSMLREASSETVRVGEETVRDASTVRYRLTVDREQADLGDGPGPRAEVDVWIDEDGLVRRIAADDDGGAFTVDFFDFGIEVAIEAPPPDKVAKLDDFLQPRPCVLGEERPIRVEQALETLRRHGFDLERDQEGCRGGLAALLTTPGDGRELDAMYREGYLVCFVFTGEGVSGFGTASAPAPGRDPPRSVDRSLENLDCNLTVEGPKADAHVERLDRALADLKRAIHP